MLSKYWHTALTWGWILLKTATIDTALNFFLAGPCMYTFMSIDSWTFFIEFCTQTEIQAMQSLCYEAQGKFIQKKIIHNFKND
jgi:hypothetical protein